MTGRLTLALYFSVLPKTLLAYIYVHFWPSEVDTMLRSTIAEVAVGNLRCFREKQTARLAPLTLLVGENSTGKTSFLAIARMLWEYVFSEYFPNFKKEPYDLGSFDEIIHRHGINGAQAETFEVEISFADALSAQITFGKEGTVPVPIRRRLEQGEAWIELEESMNKKVVKVGTSRGIWEYRLRRKSDRYQIIRQQFWPNNFLAYFLLQYLEDKRLQPLQNGPDINSTDEELIGKLAKHVRDLGNSSRWHGDHIFASAPVRSKPRRTYDPADTTPDPEGNYVPMYLADIFTSDKERWDKLKEQLEHFGRDSGLFDAIRIKKFEESGSGPFQVQIKKSEGASTGLWRNLVDVGYGVSQVLPMITELVRQENSQLFLLQQPEVHLHPSAQAALGSFFCKMAGQGRQLLIETHGRYLIDRVRMDVRDSKTELKPEDVSILFFERRNKEVRIHSLQVDDSGNILNAPKSYGRFFLEETERSLGF